MIPAGLSPEQAPPFSVPLRFFLTAPLLGLGAAVLLLLQPEALDSRWTPGALAAAHLLIGGFVVTTMLGAALQVLPVVAGAPARAPRLLGGLVHASWSLGVPALAYGLSRGGAPWILAGGAALVLATLAFLVAAGRLATTRARGDTVTGLRLAILGFATTVGLGAALALGHAGWIGLRRFTLTDLHLAWGLVGWIGALIVGVSLQVVPMLFTGPAHPRPIRAAAVPALFGLLVAWSILPSSWTGARVLLLAALALVLSSWAVVTLWSLSRRRRRLPEATVFLLRFACGSLLLACGLQVVRAAGGLGDERAAIAIVLLHGVGFASAFVVGLLLKIVPFLAWFHLQALAGKRMAAGAPAPPVPTMKDFVSDGRARLLARLHAAACVLVILAPFLPAAGVRAAALALFASLTLLLTTLVSAALAYRRAASRSP